MVTMDSGFESLKQAILIEYEDSGHVSTQTWLERHPECAAAIVDLVMMLGGSPRAIELPAEPWCDDANVALNTLAVVCKEVESQQLDAADMDLGRQLARIRSTSIPSQRARLSSGHLYMRGLSGSLAKRELG